MTTPATEPRPPQPPTDATIAIVFWRGASCAQIAAALGVTVADIEAALRRYANQRRTGGER